MSYYTNADSPFSDALLNADPDALILRAHWAEEFIRRLVDARNALIGLERPQDRQTAIKQKKMEEAVFDDILANVRNRVAGEQQISFADVWDALNDVDAEKVRRLAAASGGEELASLFSLGVTTSRIERAFHETYIVQRGSGEELCDFLIPREANSNGANLLDLHAKRVVESRQVDLELAAAHHTRVVSEALAVASEMRYLLSVAQAFSPEGNRDYRVGGALLGDAPAVSGEIAEKVANAYAKVRAGIAADGRHIVNAPNELSDKVHRAIVRTLTAAEKVQFDRFYEQGLAVMTGVWRAGAG